MKNLVVIKFGGSSITKKEENKFEINHEVLDQAVKELTEVLAQRDVKVALVCGVGAFGHTNVRKYGLNDGIRTKEQEEGVEITNKDCDFVGEALVAALKHTKLRVNLYMDMMFVFRMQKNCNRLTLSHTKKLC